MTDTRSAAQIIADILGPVPMERERSRIAHITLLENYAVELQEANERLEQQLAEALGQTKTLKGML
jgi:hypothetical protein